ncbi:MAG: YIP1 family protein [Gemmatimonadota bacterium]|nr:MAG: YIP1 family protein [Gemmatimonadota bacterium]
MEKNEPTASQRSSFVRRFVGAATFKVPIYEEVEHDKAATGQAAGVVGVVAVAAALGGLELGPGGLVAGIVGAYFGWALWSATCYLVGVQLFEGTADWGELLRTIGFAQAPGILLVLRALPGAGTWLHLAVLLWMIGTVLVAIRQALDFSTGRALATAFAGFVPYVLARTLIELLFGVTPRILP